MKTKNKKFTMKDVAKETIAEIATILHNMGKIDEATLKEYVLNFRGEGIKSKCY